MKPPPRLARSLLPALGLCACLSRPSLEPVGGFELVASPPRSEWKELEPRALEALLDDARRRVARIDDYTTVLETRERIEGALYPRRVMDLRVRQHPFQAAIEVLEPSGEAGRRVWYDPRKRGGDLLLDQPGVLGSLLGRLTLDPRGELAMENRRRPITDLGLARLVELVEESFLPALRRRAAPRIRATDAKGSGLPASGLRLVEALVPGEFPDPALCHRFGFERASGLLVYYGAAQLFPEGPALVEEYLYRDLVLDPGLSDEDLAPR